jgi:hypothetical protein
MTTAASGASGAAGSPSGYTPRITVLDQDGCMAILGRHNVGRLAFIAQGHVDIEPVHYAHRDGVLHCRTSEGAKLEALRHTPYVAFEVDEVELPWRWRSVVAHGTVYITQAEGSDHDRRAYEESVSLLRAVIPGALAPGDPFPYRTIVLRIYVAQVSGREAG